MRLADAFATQPFATFLNKARSSNIIITIAHQTLADLKKVNLTFEGQILGNCNNRFTFRTDLPEEAETLAKIIGTRTVVKKTFQSESGISTGRSSNREAEEFFFHPNIIKTLKTGECIFSMKTEGVLRQLRIPYKIKRDIVNQPIPTHRGAACKTPRGETDLDKTKDIYSKFHKKPAMEATTSMRIGNANDPRPNQ
ncbi:MAG: TraM recognition domain-containing protein [Oligoflexales bacterium]|nr:TraM recognition domain-containing protein [Oligoflexales bacterium]